VHAPWLGDFSAARNVYLDHARCRWVLSLDADEVLGDVEPDGFTRALQRHPATAFLFRIRNYFAAGDVPELTMPSKLHREYVLSRTIRLFPRTSALRYCYPVHESLLPAIRRAGVRVEQCSIPIRHTGYVNTRKSGRAKVGVYRSLGEKKIAQFPDYGLGYVELGKVYLHEHELGEASRMFKHAIRLAPRCVEAYYFLALTLLREERYAECGGILRVARRLFPVNSDIRQMAGLCRRRIQHSDSTSVVH
jgi:tetratricopeptide (TPR) repeat protein